MNKTEIKRVINSRTDRPYKCVIACGGLTLSALATAKDALVPVVSSDSTLEMNSKMLKAFKAYVGKDADKFIQKAVQIPVIANDKVPDKFVLGFSNKEDLEPVVVEVI